MASESILIVNYEPKITSLIRQVLNSAGYSVKAVIKGDSAVQTVANEQPDLVILGTALAGDIDGFETTRLIRAFSDVPIILLSNSNESTEVLRGFDLGADDYVQKPFDPKILLARVRAILKRCHGRVEEPDQIICNNLIIHQAAHRVTLNEAEIYLTETEYNLLVALARHRNQVLLHDQLLSAVWGKEFSNEVSYLRSYIHILRRKLESDPSQPRLIISWPGVGYMLSTSQDETPRN